MGTDSFTPDAGVLIAKTKNAGPGAVRLGDRRQPAGHRHDRLHAARRHRVPITIGDYRQLSDALFHAGHGLGQRVRVRRRGEPAALLRARPRTRRRRASSRTRSRSARSTAPDRSAAASSCCRRAGLPTGDGWARCRFPLHNTGRAAARRAGTRRTSARTFARTSTGCPPTRGRAAGRSGCRTSSPPRSSAGRSGSRSTRGASPAAASARIELTATSESDGSKDDTATCRRRRPLGEVRRARVGDRRDRSAR